MRPRLAGATQLLEALPKCVVGVVRRGVDLEQLLERRARPLVLAAVVVSPPKGLEDGCLAGLQPRCPLENGRGLCVVALAEQLAPPLEQGVGGLVLAAGLSIPSGVGQVGGIGLAG